MNPDPDFVLRGKSPSYWSRPGYLSNSQLTTTTQGVGGYSPEQYDEYPNSRLSESALRSMSHHLNRVSSNLKQSLTGKNSVESISGTKDLHSSLRTSATEQELVDLMRRKFHLENSYDGNARSQEVAQWYTSPVHLSQTNTPRLTSPQPIRSVSPINRPAGTLGAIVDDNHIVTDFQFDRQLRREDAVAARYFPVTLGSAYHLQTIRGGEDYPSSTTKIIRRTPSAARSKSGILKKGKRARSEARTDEMLNKFNYERDNDDLHFLAKEAPTIAASPQVITITPYQAQLAQLRMERLRIEEDRLLELKRQEELERIRGPKAKWYEMKTPEFHYEAHKNNQLIRSREKWDDILEYREDLTQASKDFRRSWETPLMA